MDFFEAQERAKKRTSRLVLMFVLAVIGTLIGGYLAAWVITGFVDDKTSTSSQSRHYRTYAVETSARPLWDPKLFGVVTVFTLAVVGLASLFKWLSFRAGGAAVAESVGARRVDPQSSDPQEHRLVNVVEEMAIASGVPMPAVYILDQEDAINAFAAGLTTSDAVVTVTRGALEKLSRDELQGVIGHEFSHILNGDMKLNVKLTALIFGILVIGLIGRGIIWSMRFGRVRSGNNKNSGGILIAIFAAGLAFLIIGYIGYFFGRLIQAAISRQREFLADASSVQFTRNPEGLTGALKKIGAVTDGSTLHARKSTELGHFFFAQGFLSSFGGLWATHPPLADRIRAIDANFDGNFAVAEKSTRFQPPSPPAPKPKPAPAQPIPPQLGSIIATIGMLTPEAVGDAQNLLASVPAGLREAARSESLAPLMIYGLLLDPSAGTRKLQQDIRSARINAESAQKLESLASALGELQPRHKLPLLQLALPSLQKLSPDARTAFFQTIDQLINADGQVTTYEFALKKVLSHSLEQHSQPALGKSQVFSFDAVAREINALLSALAHAASDDNTAALQAFAAGAAQLKPLEGKLTLLPTADCGPAALDTALDRLSAASGPIKQRLLIAGVNIVCADGTVLPAEHDLLRAFAATLDCPMPPLGTV